MIDFGKDTTIRKPIPQSQEGTQSNIEELIKNMESHMDPDDLLSAEALLNEIARDHVHLALQTQKLSRIFKGVYGEPQNGDYPVNSRFAALDTLPPKPEPKSKEETLKFIAYAAALKGRRQRFQNAEPLPEHFYFTKEWGFVNQAVESFKASFFDLTHQLQDDPSPTIKEEHRETCFQILDSFNERLQEAGTLLQDSSVEDYVWGFVFKEIFPYFMRSRFAERVYFKPKGYAGDFLMIEMLYNNIPDGDGKLGKLVDHWCLGTSPAKAVRGRRVLLRNLIKKFCERKRRTQNDPIRILNMGCGANRELFDFFSECDYTDKIQATCVDADEGALDFTNRYVNIFPHRATVRMLQDNVVKWGLGRDKFNYGKQDIIYSSGLTDYLEKKVFQTLVSRCYEYLNPGGVLIIGNFGPNNPHRNFMDYIIHWKLIHRSEETLRELFAETPFGSKVRIISEPETVNLFAVAQK